MSSRWKDAADKAKEQVANEEAAKILAANKKARTEDNQAARNLQIQQRAEYTLGTDERGNKVPRWEIVRTNTERATSTQVNNSMQGWQYNMLSMLSDCEDLIRALDSSVKASVGGMVDKVVDTYRATRVATMKSPKITNEEMKLLLKDIGAHVSVDPKTHMLEIPLLTRVKDGDIVLLDPHKSHVQPLYEQAVKDWLNFNGYVESKTQPGVYEHATKGQLDKAQLEQLQLDPNTSLQAYIAKQNKNQGFQIHDVQRAAPPPPPAPA
ncbi:MAG: hypothetical protein ACHP6H_06190, partial [Legionellales bacterium]